MRKAAIALLAFWICTLSAPAQTQTKTACGPDVRYSTKRVKGRAAIETAPLPVGKAIVYILRPTHFGALIASRLAMDGKWVGINKANSYFVFWADVGQHDFCSESENESHLSMNLETGKTYYLQQHVRQGVFEARNKISELGEVAGKAALAKCQLMIFWEKGKPQPSN